MLNIGKRLYIQRTINGVELESLAKDLISPLRLRRIENGYIVPSTTLLESIAARLDLPSVFFTNYEEMDMQLLYLLNQLFEDIILGSNKAKSLIELIDDNYYEYLLSPKLECYFLLLKVSYLIKSGDLTTSDQIVSNFLDPYFKDINIDGLPLYLRKAYHYTNGLYNYYQQDYDQCLVNYSILKNMVENLLEKAVITYNIGLIYQQLGKHQQTISIITEVIAYYDKLDLPYESALAYNLLGAAYRGTKSYKEAHSAFKSAQSYAEEFRYFDILGFIFHNTGMIFKDSGNIKKAIELFTKSIEMKEKDNHRNLSITYRELIECHLLVKNIDKAHHLHSIAESLKINEDQHYRLLQAFNEYYRLNQNLDEYLSNLKQLIKYFLQVDDKYELRKCYTQIGKYYYRDRKYKLASEYFLKNIELSEG